MYLKAFLVVILIMGVLFAWRAWKPYPGMAVLAGAVAAVAGVLLLRYPALAGAGVLAAAVLIFHFSRPRT
jgi:hypothetical protein